MSVSTSKVEQATALDTLEARTLERESSEPEEKPSVKRGRKCKYATDEERVEARRRQQREYRQRKKEELERLRQMVAESQKQSESKK